MKNDKEREQKRAKHRDTWDRVYQILGQNKGGAKIRWDRGQRAQNLDCLGQIGTFGHPNLSTSVHSCLVYFPVFHGELYNAVALIHSSAEVLPSAHDTRIGASARLDQH